VDPHGVPRPGRVCHDLIGACSRAIGAHFWDPHHLARNNGADHSLRAQFVGIDDRVSGGTGDAGEEPRSRRRSGPSGGAPESQRPRTAPTARLLGMCLPFVERCARPGDRDRDVPGSQSSAAPKRGPVLLAFPHRLQRPASCRRTPTQRPYHPEPFDLAPIQPLRDLLDRGAFRFWNERPRASVTPVSGAMGTMTWWGGCRHVQSAVGRKQGSCRKPGSIHTNPTPGGLHGLPAFLFPTGN